MQTTKPIKIVVLGGGYAGTLAALRLAGKTKRHATEIVLVNGVDHFVERIRHHQLAAGQTQKVYPFAKLLGSSGVRFVQGWCTALSSARKALTVETSTGTQTLTYDYLIYALGSTTEKARIPGVAEYAYTLADETTAGQLQQRAQALAKQQGRLLIIGGGLTGIEAATELAERYPSLQVALATKGKLGATLSPAGASHVHRVFAKLGIALMEETAVERLTTNAAHTSAGRTLPFDACLWAGAFVVPKLAIAAGLPVDNRGRILVDEWLRVSNDDSIYAAGDVVSTPLRMACATALPMGAYVADHLAAQITGHAAPAPFQFAYLLQCISLGRHNGLVQFVQSDDTPKPRIITGWAAARIKELICRFTVWSLHQERRWAGSYTWPHGTQIVGHTARGGAQQAPYGHTAANL